MQTTGPGPVVTPKGVATHTTTHAAHVDRSHPERSHSGTHGSHDESSPVASGTRRLLALGALAFTLLSYLIFTIGAALSYKLLPEGTDRDNVASFSIFLFCMQALLLLAAGFVLMTGKTHLAAGLMSCFLILVISWLVVEADKVLMLARGASRDLAHEQKVNTWLAGLIMLTIANIALLVIFQLRHLHPAAPAAKTAKTDSTTPHGKNTAVGGVVTEV